MAYMASMAGYLEVEPPDIASPTPRVVGEAFHRAVEARVLRLPRPMPAASEHGKQNVHLAFVGMNVDEAWTPV